MKIIIKICFLSSLFIWASCGSQQVTVTEEQVEELKVNYNKGKIETIEDIISVFQDSSQPVASRIAAMKALAKTDHPDARDALRNYLSTGGNLNYALMTATAAEILKTADEDDMDAAVRGIATAQEKYINFRSQVFTNLQNQDMTLQVEQILSIYQLERENYVEMQESLTRTMGSVSDERIVPILINVASDKTQKPSIRSLAMEILGKKSSPQVTEFFTSMLNDPDDQLKVRRFAIEAVSDVRDSRVILALLESFNRGRDDYYTLLEALTRALGSYNQPDIIPALIEITKDAGLPLTIRRNALSALAQYKDKTIFDQLLPMMMIPDNYLLYDEMSRLAAAIETGDPLQELRITARRAQQANMVQQ